jgi:hypothetical protein
MKFTQGIKINLVEGATGGENFDCQCLLPGQLFSDPGFCQYIVNSPGQLY